MTARTKSNAAQPQPNPNLVIAGFVGFAYQPSHTSELFTPLKDELGGTNQSQRSSGSKD